MFGPKAKLIENYCERVGEDCDGFIYDHNGEKIGDCEIEHFDYWYCSKCDYGNAVGNPKTKRDVEYHIAATHRD